MHCVYRPWRGACACIGETSSERASPTCRPTSTCLIVSVPPTASTTRYQKTRRLSLPCNGRHPVDHNNTRYLLRLIACVIDSSVSRAFAVPALLFRCSRAPTIIHRGPTSHCQSCCSLALSLTLTRLIPLPLLAAPSLRATRYIMKRGDKKTTAPATSSSTAVASASTSSSSDDTTTVVDDGKVKVVVRCRYRIHTVVITTQRGTKVGSHIREWHQGPSTSRSKGAATAKRSTVSQRARRSRSASTTYVDGAISQCRAPSALVRRR